MSNAEKNKVHDFQKSLKKGQKRELEFFELFKDKLEKLDGYTSDFKLRKNGRTIELKTDEHCPTKTKNFFIERYSYSQEPGGPYQALKKNSYYFIFWFPITMAFHVFKTKDLVEWLEKNYADPYLLNIYNTAHVTKGFLVPRAELESLEIKMEDIL